MSGIITWLQGKKTYVILILGFVFNFGVAIGWWTIDSQLWEIINYILGFLGLGTIGAKINRTAKK
jgi:hypothetical protein